MPIRYPTATVIISFKNFQKNSQNRYHTVNFFSRQKPRNLSQFVQGYWQLCAQHNKEQFSQYCTMYIHNEDLYMSEAFRLTSCRGKFYGGGLRNPMRGHLQVILAFHQDLLVKSPSFTQTECQWNITSINVRRKKCIRCIKYNNLQ